MFSKYEDMADITLLSRNMLGKSINSIPLSMNGILMTCLKWLISESRSSQIETGFHSKAKCFICGQKCSA